MKKLLILLLFPLMMFAQDTTLIGDVDCSGEVNSQDASLILQFVTNVIDELPCEANMTGLTPEQLQEMIDMMEDQLNINYTGTSGGGCDYRWPEGFDGEAITEGLESGLSYIVPDGKRLYINYSNNCQLVINGKNLENGTIDRGTIIMLNSGDILTGAENCISSLRYFNGYLVNAVEDVIAITEGLESGLSYIVPDGKRLYINYSNNCQLVINGKNLENSTIGSGSIIMLNSGDILTGAGNCTASLRYFNGYLVDEDYFADCAGGGGSTTLLNTSGNNTSNMITASDLNLTCKDYIVLDNLYSSDPLRDISIDNASNVYIIRNLDSGGNMYTTGSSIVKYDSLLNLVWEINNPGVHFTSGIRYNENNNKLYVVGKLGGFWPSGSTYNWNIGTESTGNFNGCQIGNGYGFVAELNPSDGSCNWASPITIGNGAWGYQNPMFTFNNDYLCFISMSDQYNGFWNLHTYDIADGTLVYSEYNIGGTNQAGCALSNSNELIVKNYGSSRLFNIFDGSYDSSISYSSGAENNNLLFSPSGEILTFYKQNNNYNIRSENQGGSSTLINDSFQVGGGGDDYYAYKTNQGYSLLISYSELHMNVWNQLYVTSYSDGQYMMIDTDFNFNIINSLNISGLCDFYQSKFAVSSNGKKALFLSMDNGAFMINGNQYNGDNNFLMLFD